MKFNDWMAQVKKQQEKIGKVAICDITETISADGNCYSITLGQKLVAEIDGNATDIRYFRHDYTNNKPEFDAMLEALETRADETAKAAAAVLLAITSKAIPGKVLQRMIGEDVSGDPEELLDDMVKKEIERLEEFVDKEELIFGLYVISFPIGEKELGISSHGEITFPIATLQEKLDFLVKLPLIESKIKRFCACLEEIKKIKES